MSEKRTKPKTEDSPLTDAAKPAKEKWTEGTDRTQYLVKDGQRHPVKVKRVAPPSVEVEDLSKLPIAK